MDNGKELYDCFLSRGDQEAFAELMLRYKDGLIGFIYRFVRRLDVAEDLSQDVFVTLLLRCRRFEGEATLKTYLYTVGRNRAVDWLRKNRRVILSERANDRQDEEAAEVEEHLLKTEGHRMLHRAMQTLPADYGEVLHLLYFEDLSYKEAAKVMKKTEKQIENLAYRARKALKVTLGKEDADLEKR